MESLEKGRGHFLGDVGCLAPRERDPRSRHGAVAAGASPERMIVELKTFLRSTAVVEVGTWFRDVLLDRAVSWAIQAYYGVRDA